MFPLHNRKKKRASARCAEKSPPCPAACCRALFGTHNYLLCNAYLLQTGRHAVFIKYLWKVGTPKHTCLLPCRAPARMPPPRGLCCGSFRPALAATSCPSVPTAVSQAPKDKSGCSSKEEQLCIMRAEGVRTHRQDNW